MADVKKVLETGAKEAVTTESCALGVVAVLASGTIISSYMGLFGRSRAVRTLALGALSASLFGYAAVGGASLSGRMKTGAKAFSGTLGLMTLVALVQEVMGGKTSMESQVYPVGEGRVIGSMTSEDTFSPIGTVSNNAETFAAEEAPVAESPSWNPIDMSQYNPLDGQHQDMGYALLFGWEMPFPKSKKKSRPHTQEMLMLAEQSLVVQTMLSSPILFQATL